MAQDWCVSYGVLPFDEAEKLNKRVTDRKRKIRLAGGTVPPSAGSSSPQKPKKKKARVMKELAVDPDLAASNGDGIGRASL
jgi:hypothetical protein